MSFLDRIKNLFRSPAEQATNAAITAGNVWAATAAVQQSVPFQQAQQEIYNAPANDAQVLEDAWLGFQMPQLELAPYTPQESFQLSTLTPEQQMALDINKEADAIALAGNVALWAADVINNPQDYDSFDLQNKWEQLWMDIGWDWALGSALSTIWWVIWAWLDFVWDNASWVYKIATGDFKEWFNTLLWAWVWLAQNIWDSFSTSTAESEWMWENYQEYLNKVERENAGISTQNFFTSLWGEDWAAALVKSWIDYSVWDYLRYEVPYFWWKALKEDKEENEVNMMRLADIINTKSDAEDPIIALANGQITADQYETMWGKNLTEEDFKKAWYKSEDDFLDKQRFFSTLAESQKAVAAKILPKTWVDREEIVENVTKQKAYTTQFFWWEDYTNIYDSLEWEAKAKFVNSTKQSTEYLWRELAEYNKYLVNWTKRTNEWTKEQKDVFDAYTKTTSFLKENAQYQMLMEMEARARWIENPTEYASKKYKEKYGETVDESWKKKMWDWYWMDRYISPEDYIDRVVKKATIDSDGRWQNVYSDMVNTLSLWSAAWLWDTTEALADWLLSWLWVPPSDLQRLELQPIKKVITWWYRPRQRDVNAQWLSDTLYANADVVWEIAWSIAIDLLASKWSLTAWKLAWNIWRLWKVWELIKDATLIAGKASNADEFIDIVNLWKRANTINVFDNILQSQRQNVIYGSMAQSLAGEPYNPAIDWVLDIMLWWPFDLLDAARARNKSLTKWIKETDKLTFKIWTEEIVAQWKEAMDLIKQWNMPVDWFKLTADQLPLWALLKSWDAISEKNIDAVKAMFTLQWDAAIQALDKRLAADIAKAPVWTDWVAYVDETLQRSFAQAIARKRFAEIMEAWVKSWDLTWYLNWAKWEIDKIWKAIKQWKSPQEVSQFLIPHKIWEAPNWRAFETSWLLWKSQYNTIANGAKYFTFGKAPKNTTSIFDTYKNAENIVNKIDKEQQLKWELAWVISAKKLQTEVGQDWIDNYVRVGVITPQMSSDWVIESYRIVTNEQYKTLLETAKESDKVFFDSLKSVMKNNWLSDVANDKIVGVFSKLKKVLCA